MLDLHKAWMSVVGFVLLVAALLLWRQHERHAGALAILTHQADSVRVVQAHVTDSTNDEKVKAEAVATKLRLAARVEVRRDSAQQVQTDSVLRATAAERQRAEQLLADSVATIGALRGEVGRLVESGRRDSIAFDASRTSLLRTQTALLSAVAADSLAIRSGTAAYAALLAQNTTLAGEVRLLKQQQPSLFGNVIRAAAAGAAGFGVGRFR